MSGLIKYDAARFALQQAVAVDEVKDIRDKAQAMAAYAKQAKDTELVQWATEIKVRAERKAGQMLAELGLKSGNPELSVKNANPSQTWPPQWSHDATIGKTLPELGISKTQSSRWQKLASVPEEQFEQAVAAAKEVAGEVTTAAMLRIEKANRPEVAPQLAPKKKASPPENPTVAESLTVEESYPQADEEPNEQVVLIDALESTVEFLAAENERLSDKNLALGSPEEVQGMITKTFESLRAENKTLKINLDAVTRSRDQLMNENASLKKQCKINESRIKKLMDAGKK